MQTNNKDLYMIPYTQLQINYTKMAAMKVGLVDFVSCPVCFERDGEPKRFPCDHTCCVGCVQNMVDKARETETTHGQQPGSQISCPECRLTVDISGGKADNLPTHLLMKQLREVLAGGHAGEDNKKPKCQFCDNGRHIEAFCADCKMFMCSLCSETHTKRAPFKNHTLRQIPVFCQVHKQPATFTCTDCQILLCILCVNDRICEDHDIKDVTELSEHVTTKTDNLIEDIQKHIDEIRVDIKHKNKTIKELQEHVKKSESDICAMKDLLLAAKDAREKGVEQMILATPVIMSRLPQKKTHVYNEVDVRVSTKQPSVNVEQKYNLTKKATLLWKNKVNYVYKILFTPGQKVVMVCHNKHIIMYDTKGNLISDKTLNFDANKNWNIHFGTAHDAHTSSVVVACGTRGLAFYSDTDLEWKQDLILQRVAKDVTLSAYAVGVLSNSNLVVATNNEDTNHTVGIYDRKGTLLNMIMNYGIGKQLPVDNTHHMTVLKDDTIVVLMTNQSAVFFDGALQCLRVLDICVDKYRGYSTCDLGTSPEGNIAYVIVRNEQTSTTLLLPDMSIQRYDCLQDYIRSIAIQNGNIAVAFLNHNSINVFQAYIDIHIPNIKDKDKTYYSGLTI